MTGVEGSIDYISPRGTKYCPTRKCDIHKKIESLQNIIFIKLLFCYIYNILNRKYEVQCNQKMNKFTNILN